MSDQSERPSQPGIPEQPSRAELSQDAILEAALELVFHEDAVFAVRALRLKIQEAEADGSIDRILLAAIGHRRALHKEMMQLKAEKEQLEKEVLIDPKTGLGSWRNFERRASHLKELMVEGSKRKEDKIPQAVVAVSTDVIGLKLTNDTIGEEAGDDRLILCSDALTKTFRDGDFYRLNAARSDEIVGIIPIYGDTKEESAAALEAVINRLINGVPVTYKTLLEEMRDDTLGSGKKTYLQDFPDEIPLRAAFAIFERLDEEEFSYESIGQAVKAAEPKIMAQTNPAFMINFAHPNVK